MPAVYTVPVTTSVACDVSAFTSLGAKCSSVSAVYRKDGDRAMYLSNGSRATHWCRCTLGNVRVVQSTLASVVLVHVNSPLDCCVSIIALVYVCVCSRAGRAFAWCAFCVFCT